MRNLCITVNQQSSTSCRLLYRRRRSRSSAHSRWARIV